MSGRNVPPPNYTQAPNLFFDELLPAITSMSELKVTAAIVRQTFGYHKDEDRLSLSRLVVLTGLSRKSVAEGVKLALNRGYVGRRKEGDTFVYGLRVASEESTPPPDRASEESTPLASEESTPTKERRKETPLSPPASGGRRAKTLKSDNAEDHASMVADFVTEDALGTRVNRLLKLAAGENKSGRMRYSKAWTAFVEPLKALRDDGVSDAALAFGLDAALQAEAPNLSYVKKAARNYSPDSGNVVNINSGRSGRPEPESQRVSTAGYRRF